MGVEQTEIDALASLQPDLLDRIARAAIGPFFDYTLTTRVHAARREWVTAAQTIVDESMDPERLDRLRDEAADKLREMRSEIDALNDALRVDTDDLDLPEMAIPTADVTDRSDGKPLVDSRWSFAEQSRRLIDSKAYRVGEAME